MELDSLYQEVILDHYKKPHHKGLPTGEIQVHHVNPNCGDEITLSLAIRDGKVEDLVWDGVGCSISQASASIMSELVSGKSVADAQIALQEFTEMMQSKGKYQGKEEILEDAVALAGVSKISSTSKVRSVGVDGV